MADLTALPPAPAVAAPLQVVPVENLQTLQIWRQCSAAGFGSAISWAMLQEAKKRGYTQAYVWSSNWGRNVYRNVGFVPIEMGMREYEWQRKGAAHDDRNSLPTTLPVYGYCHGDTCAYNCW